jgi:uncharacterized protein (TIGR02231 family)
MVKGTTIGTVSDGSGNYSLALPNGSTQLVFSFIGLQTEEVAVTQPVINMQLQPDATQLEEVVVSAYGTSGGDYSPSIRPRERVMKEKIITTTVIENQTTVEIEVQVPYTIKSNGEKLQVELRKNQIDALYEYYAVPKIDKDAFLVARVVNWDQYNLLAGEANLYFEDTYVGRSILDARALQDTLTISLGRDKNLVVGREKNEQFSKRKMIGGNVVETRGFKIVARNKKSQAVKLTIFDQIPKAVLSDIVVNAVELSKGQLEETTGKLKWELSLMPQQQKEIILQYEVRYPKRERVVLE